MDPEIKTSLQIILQIESKKVEKEESKVKAEKALAGLKARSGLF